MNPTDKKNAAIALADQPLDTEALLLDRLKNSANADDYFRWLLFVVGYYRGIDNVEAATDLLQSFIKTSQDSEQRAHCYLALGQIATDEQRLEDALKNFRLALDLVPKKRKVAYVLHNNIGFCLNTLGRYGDGEIHCRKAIELDWTRASGYRNLGISLHGQEKIHDAAWALVEAVRIDPTDNRAGVFLKKLLVLNPVLAVRCPWAAEALLLESSAESDVPLN